jgi:hypothetical protein
MGGWAGNREKRHGDVIAQGESGFRSSMLLAWEAIVRRNVAAIEPDRIQTRCRDDVAWAQVSRQSNRCRPWDWSARRAILYRHSKMGVSRCVTAQ